MKIVSGYIFQFLWALSIPLASSAFDLPSREPFRSNLSLQGYTGILNTPNAYVTQEGFIDGLYSNQKEQAWRNKTSYQDNYLLSLGIFSMAEAGARLTNAPGAQVRDLSAHIKLSSEPFFRQYQYVPVFAAGYQDLGGGLKQMQNRYVVVSEDIWRLRLSAGYGFGPQRMKGAFVGGEFKVCDWLYLLGEYDTKETNLGLRIVTPQIWKSPIRVTATSKIALNDKPGHVEIAAGFTFPLDFQPRPVPSGLPEEPSTIVTESPSYEPPAPPANPVITDSVSDAGMAALRERLVMAGFRDVRVGTQKNATLVIEYENVTFNHNELDALGVVSGMAVEAFGNDFRFITMVIKKKGIRMLTVSMPLPELAVFIEGGSNGAGLMEQVTFSRGSDYVDEVTFEEGSAQDGVSPLASLVLWPGLTTLVGTEFGAFDYLLSIKPELFITAWKGGVVNVRGDIPVLWSDNLDNGKPYRNRRTPARLERLMLFQGVKPSSDIMANLGVGMVAPDTYGTLNELVWTPGTGEHAIRLAQSWGRNDTNNKTIDTYLGSYRYYWDRPDLFITGTAGKFAAQDRGFSFELKRMFGDTSFSVYYKNSVATDNRHWQAIGATISFPLTPRKEMNPYYGMQVRGTDEWAYSQETVVARARNEITSFPLAAVPVPTASLHNQYLNRDRLNQSYILSHFSRLRDAWIVYREKL